MNPLTARDRLEDVVGEICRMVLPIKDTYFLGSGEEIAVCTLGSMDLLNRIAHSEMMDNLCVAGRLLSENAGIEQLVRFTCCHPRLNTLLLCGREVSGHLPGQALESLFNNGIDDDGRIRGATGHRPVVGLTRQQVQEFVCRISLINLKGETDYDKISRSIS